MRWGLIMAAILLQISTISLSANASSQGVFQLRLKSFMNKLGKDSNNRCCAGFRTSSGKCSESCSTKFRVCLKHYQATIDPAHECTFGEEITPVLGSNSIFMSEAPIEFALDFKWPGTFSLIIEAWHQNNKSTAGNDLISQMATQQELDAGSTWTHGVHQETHTRLEYEYRMVCSSHYYGKDCDTLCRPRDDQFGHYTCDSNGDKICLDGWQKDSNNAEGDYCTKAVCSPGCHNEHGYCVLPDQCKCRDGWEGPSCTDCIRYPGCQHGTCNEPWKCDCQEGWGGLFCNQDLNYCTNNHPCKNGATCFNTGQGSYTCSCSPGWTGTKCETRITNECAHNMCINGGTCQGTGVNNYTCVCPLGFHGEHCELQAQTCSDMPCKNGANCVDTPAGYECKCNHGFTGVNCNVKVDHCRMATPCKNGGTCLMDHQGPEDAYQCICPAGFSGEHCQSNIDDCAVNPCQNGGTCIDFVNDYKCYCLPGFNGTHCQINVNECRVNPCANGGTCHDSVNDFVCACRPGFSGKDCSVEINECARNPCMHNGFCVDKLNDYECRCLPGYRGKACNVLPDGTILPLTGMNQHEAGTNVALVVTLATILPLIMILGCLLVICKKRKQSYEQRKANAQAKIENELNAVNCVNKTKMINDIHMIDNDLDYPKHKRLNNPNLANSDEISYQQYDKQCVNKQLNTNCSSKASLLMDKLDKESSCSASTASTSSHSKQIRSHNHKLTKAGLEQFNSECSSSTTSSTGAPSVCSSDSVKSKKYDLPTAQSIAAMRDHRTQTRNVGTEEFHFTEV